MGNGVHVQKIEGLEALAGLHELNLAGNEISALGHGLDSNAELETLYLSGNPLCSLQVRCAFARPPVSQPLPNSQFFEL